jgi:hypothetical protein
MNTNLKTDIIFICNHARKYHKHAHKRKRVGYKGKTLPLKKKTFKRSVKFLTKLLVKHNHRKGVFCVGYPTKGDAKLDTTFLLNRSWKYYKTNYKGKSK